MQKRQHGGVRDAKSAFETFDKIRVSLHLVSTVSALDQVSGYFFKRGGVEEERLREGLRKAGFDAPPEVVKASLCVNLPLDTHCLG